MCFKKERNSEGAEQPHKLETDYKVLKSNIDNYFINSETENRGKIITDKINELLLENFLINDDRNATISLTGSELTDILKQLDLILESNKSGLGSLNLLCIAAELLLFNEVKQGLKLTLIEELEAHLHPQYQLRLIDYINEKQNIGQFILTTHSTTLASKIKLENLIICKNEYAFPMGHKHTQLNESDYRFLERFLDATKANLFFAKGVIIVEGDAENLLIPTIAKLIDRPLHKYGVSIVNVGSTAFKRYAKIFLRNELPNLNIPVSIISDLDIRSLEYYNDEKIPEVTLIESLHIHQFKGITEDVDYSHMPKFFVNQSDFENYILAYKSVKRFPPSAIQKRLVAKFNSIGKTVFTETIISHLREDKRSKINASWTGDLVKIFLPLKWTLEYDIACSELYKYLESAIFIASKEKNNPTEPIVLSDIQEIQKDTESKYEDQELTSEISYDIFKPLCKGTISKASTAQYLAELLELSNTESAITNIIETDQHLKYLCEAIYHVTEQPKHQDEHE